MHEQDALIAELTQANAKLTADLAVVQSELNKVRNAALQERSVCIEMCRNVDAEQAKLAAAQAKLAADQAKLAADKRELASLMKELDRSIAAQQQRDADLHRLKKELALEREQLAAERQQRQVDRAFEEELGKLNDALEIRVKELEASLAIAQLPAPTPAAPAATPAPPKLVVPSGMDRRKSIGVAVGTKMAADQLQALAELENLMTPSRPVRNTNSSNSSSSNSSNNNTATKASASRLRMPTATPKRADK